MARLSTRKNRARADRGTLESPGSLPGTRPGKPGGRRDSNRRQRLAELGRVAVRLYLARGVDAVAVADLAAAAGMAKAGFYRYFDGQEQLVAALVEPLRRHLSTAMSDCERALAAASDPAALPGVYLALAADLWRVVPEHSAVVRLYLQESGMPSVGPRRPIARMASEVEERAIRITTIARDQGLIRDLDPRIVALVVVGAVERLLRAALARRRPGPPAEVARILVSTVVDGIRRR